MHLSGFFSKLLENTLNAVGKTSSWDLILAKQWGKKKSPQAVSFGLAAPASPFSLGQVPGNQLRAATPVGSCLW